MMTVEQRFWSKVEKTDACWLWRGTLSCRGWGRFSVRGRHLAAHRFSYELLVGPIPEGLEIDHLCFVRPCVNPAHLEPVTRAENIRRIPPENYKKRLKPHCRNGHRFTEENIRLRSDNTRECRICATARYERHEAARKKLSRVLRCRIMSPWKIGNARENAS